MISGYKFVLWYAINGLFKGQRDRTSCYHGMYQLTHLFNGSINPKRARIKIK